MSKKNSKKQVVKKSVSTTQKLIAYMSSLIEKGKFNRKQIVANCEKRFPETAKSSIVTILSDGKNEKYSRFAKLIQEGEGKVLSF